MKIITKYVADFLSANDVKFIFMVTGGGAMFLNNAFGTQPGLKCVFNHHEQACAIAAEGYARISGKPGVVCVTTGPGGTNAITGVLGQWLDSIPALYISGQVRYDTTVASTGLPLRQFGDQEANIVDLVRPITKYAVMVTDPSTIRYHFEKALYLATHGRPGPTWLDIPLNVQSSQVDEASLTSFVPAEEELLFDSQNLENQVDTVVEKLAQAERPLILAGAGIRLAGATSDFNELVERLRIPVQVAWDAIDLLPSDHLFYAGRPSTLGQRGANFIFQNCDLLISIGCRLNVRQIGYTFPAVARAAYKVSVDIDPVELKKPSMKIDLPIQADAKTFIQMLKNRLDGTIVPEKSHWLKWCKDRLNRYPVVLEEYFQQDSPVNPYVFCEALSKILDNDDAIISSNGSSCVIPIQTFDIRAGQRHIVNSGCAAMGYGLPAAIGACFARNKKRTVCLDGDGSIQLNLQELQTIVHHQLPIKIFVFNNNGYLSIRQTQANFFNGFFVGESPQSGVSFPDMTKIASAYGIPCARLEKHSQIRDLLPEILAASGPFLCDVVMDPNQNFMPRIASKRLTDGRMVSSPLEDMYPFLERDEFLSNMIIPPWEPENTSGSIK